MLRVVLLLAVTFIIFGNSLSNQLFFDDEELIYKNEFVQHLSYLPQYLTTNMVAGAGKMSNMYRPLLITSFAIDHAIWGDTSFGYHLTNILLHAINGVLVYLLICLLFDQPYIAMVTAILFIIHPIQSEAIAYASGRTDPLSTMWILLTTITFYKSLGKRHSLPLLITSLFCFILAILSKETAIMTPCIFLLILYTKKYSRHTYVTTFPFFGITLLYIVLRLTILNFSNSLNFYQTQTLYSTNILVRIWTFLSVLFHYIFVLLFPKNLVYAHQVSIVTNPFNWLVILSIISISILIYLTLHYRKKYPLLLFSLCWFFLFLLPSSGIIPINSIMQEHYLYLPSVAIFLLCSTISVYVYKRLPNNFLSYSFILLSVFILCLLSIRTYTRNADWHDPITFYSKDSSRSADEIIMKNNLAMEYANKGDLEKAILQYKQLIQIADIYPNTHHNLANAYTTQGKFKEAEEEYKKALQIDPNFRFSALALENLYKTHKVSPN